MPQDYGSAFFAEVICAGAQLLGAGAVLVGPPLMSLGGPQVMVSVSSTV